MIDLRTLRKTARMKGIRNIGYAEKDYFQEIILLAISREAPDLVFKGGTCIYKLHGLDRFSEDLDFSGMTDDVVLKRIATYLDDFGYPSEIAFKRMDSGLLATFRIKGFLYEGDPRTLARVQLDFSLKDQEKSGKEHRTFFSLYPDIPSFRVCSLPQGEILAEKIRALIVRNRARDLYDVHFLLLKGVEPDRELILGKLANYDIELSVERLEERFAELEGIWDMELIPLLFHVPDFGPVKMTLKEKLIPHLSGNPPS